MGECVSRQKPRGEETVQQGSPNKIKMAGQTKKTVKMVLCGNADVGKTSITMRYKSGIFSGLHETTVGGVY